MPIPTREQVIDLLGRNAERLDCDVEEVAVTRAGSHSVVRVIVDRDRGFELDAIADLSRTVSEILDALDDGGNTPYNLEVTTPGVDRPLTLPRHWVRARGRWVGFVGADGGRHEGRIGRTDGTSVDIVERTRSGPVVRTVPLAEISDAVVQVEFRTPNPGEIELAGGVTPGRIDPLAEAPEFPDITDPADDTLPDE